ncbi:hypothetical protein DUI87_18314 [Hirundo rustica rustica]|uniref:Uncharacterized protein n=1 Tax=Hirundo rustica rustica TaxID=333673 RepID=A0A3M0JVS5_HIRRU|nr:hypothetical protein DUI87_18314 [Hirundo rustica rustica]
MVSLWVPSLPKATTTTSTGDSPSSRADDSLFHGQMPQDMEAPPAVSNIVKTIKVTWEQDSWASTMVY